MIGRVIFTTIRNGSLVSDFLAHTLKKLHLESVYIGRRGSGRFLQYINIEYA